MSAVETDTRLTVMDLLPKLGAGAPPILAPGIKEPGVYFGMPEGEYHAAFALSASGIKNLRISTLDFWARSRLNPDHKDEETDALKIGRAYHKRIVEGGEAFYRTYAPTVDPADHPGALRTADDLRARLKELGLKVSGNKGDLIDRLLEAGDATPIWDEIVESHAFRHQDKELLPADLIHRIEVSAAMIERHPQLGKAFSGGYPEVSVFWHDEATGVPMKARFDYLKPRAIVDLKTFENIMGMPIDKAIARAVAANKYHIQAAHYLDAADRARELISAGAVNGEVEQSFLDALVAADERKFLFVWQQKGIAPLARGKVLEPGLTLDLGRFEVETAKRTFRDCWDRFGTDPWIDTADIMTFDSSEFPAFIAD